MKQSLAAHWPEYLMEAAGLGIFMISACTIATALEHPDSPLRHAISSPLLRRFLMGLAMGSTAIAIIYSPWGKQSGAHINPSITLTFLRLGKINPWDAVFYVGAQFAGALSGVFFIALLLGNTLAHPSVNYVATIPGRAGTGLAFIAEAVISFILMLLVLISTNTQNLARFTGFFAGALVATYITIEAPISGMSMNPARTFGSALPGQIWTALWVYFTAPLLGMLAAAELYIKLKGIHQIFCAKLNHYNNKRCIFRCSFKDNTFADREQRQAARRIGAFKSPT